MNALELKENRKKMKLTQEELASKLGVDRRTILNYEKGEVIPESKVKLLHIIFNQANDESENKENDPYIEALTDKLFSSEKFKTKLKENQKQISSEELIAIVLKYLKEAE